MCQRGAAAHDASQEVWSFQERADTMRETEEPVVGEKTHGEVKRPRHRHGKTEGKARGGHCLGL